MRSKRSKAWHRRTEEKARAMRLIERGSPSLLLSDYGRSVLVEFQRMSKSVSALWAKKLADSLLETRESIIHKLLVQYDEAPRAIGTIKFRPFRVESSGLATRITPRAS